jgi:hypothetical protein
MPAPRANKATGRSFIYLPSLEGLGVLLAPGPLLFNKVETSRYEQPSTGFD